MKELQENRSDVRWCSDLRTITERTGLDKRTIRKLAIETGSLIRIGSGKGKLLILDDEFKNGLKKFRVTE